MPLNENRVMLGGALGADAEFTHTTQKQAPVIKLSLATNKRWRNAAGGREERTEWHSVEYYPTEAMVEYLKPLLLKGASVYVVGEIRYDVYDDAKGSKQKRAIIKAESVQFVHAANVRTEPEREATLPTGIVRPSANGQDLTANF